VDPIRARLVLTMPTGRDTLDDLFNGGKTREGLSFSGDGDRLHDPDGPPGEADPPITRASVQTLRASGSLAARKILSATALTRRIAGEAKITDEMLAEQLTVDLKRFDGKPNALDAGLHAGHHLAPRCLAGQWSDAWDRGYTESPAWDNPISRSSPRAHGATTFTLRPGVSASQGLAQWLAGFTVADRISAMIAIHLHTVCSVAGAEVFDACFGRVDRPGALGRLALSSELAYTPLESLLRNAKARPGELGKRSALPGESYYFANAPTYRYKHPAGSWRGERCVYLGDEAGQQMWNGFGTHGSEADILRELVVRYNAPRDGADHAWLQAFFADQTAPAEYAIADDQITIDTLRPFGLDPSTGFALNAQAIDELVSKYRPR
jgi:hypothetical protein